MKTPEEWYKENGSKVLDLNAREDQGHLLMSEVMTAMKLYGDYRHNNAVDQCADHFRGYPKAPLSLLELILKNKV